MSSFTILKSVSIIGLGAMIGYATVKGIMATNSPNRYLASATMSKMAVEQFSKSILDVKVSKTEAGMTESDSSTVEVSSNTRPMRKAVVSGGSLAPPL